jgi:Transmembrane protein 131-like N-terminal/CARDB
VAWAALQIVSNDADKNPFRITLGGTGVAAPKIVVEQPTGTNLVDGIAALAFGNSNIGATVTKIVTVRNTGTAKLTSLKLSVSGKNSSDFTATDISVSSLAPGNSTTFKVVFKPASTGSRSAVFKPLAEGTRKAELRIKSNDPDNKSFDIKLNGFGKAHEP